MVLFRFAFALAALATSVIASPTTSQPELVKNIDDVVSKVQSLNTTLQVFFNNPDEAEFKTVLTTGLSIHVGLVTATTNAGHAISETDGVEVAAALQASVSVMSSTLNYLTVSFAVIENNTVYVSNIAKALAILVTDLTRFGIVLAVNMPCDLRAGVETVADTYIQSISLALDTYMTVQV